MNSHTAAALAARNRELRTKLQVFIDRTLANSAKMRDLHEQYLALVAQPHRSAEALALARRQIAITERQLDVEMPEARRLALEANQISRELGMPKSDADDAPQFFAEVEKELRAAIATARAAFATEETRAAVPLPVLGDFTL